MPLSSSYLVKRFLIVIFFLFFFEQLTKVPLVNIFGLKDISSDNFAFYQFFTHVFFHANLSHLLRNAFAIWLFGTRLEITLGKKYFLILVLISSLGSASLQAYITHVNLEKIRKTKEIYDNNPTPTNFKRFLSNFPSTLEKQYSNFVKSFENNSSDNIIQLGKEIITELYNLRKDTPSIGASGIIFGFLASFAMIFPNQLLYFLFLPIPIKAKYFVLIYGLYELYAGSKNNPSDNVGHFAHLGGLISGYIFIRWLLSRHKLKNRS